MGNFFTGRSIQEAMKNVEVVLAVGTWFQGGPRLWNIRMPGKLIHVDIDAKKIGLNHHADIHVIGDALLAINGIRSSMGSLEAGDDGFLKAMQSAREGIKRQVRDRIGPDHEGIMDAMRELSPDDAVFVRDMTVPAYLWANQLLPIYGPRTTMTTESGGIGIGFPLAIGAAIGTGKKTIAIQGDGGFMVHIGELSTAVQYRIPLIICVFNDGGYGILRNIQKRTFEGRTIGVDLATPDFKAVAIGMGMEAESVSSLDGFKTVFKKAIEGDGPFLIDINTTALKPISGFENQ